MIVHYVMGSKKVIDIGYVIFEWSLSWDGRSHQKVAVQMVYCLEGLSLMDVQNSGGGGQIGANIEFLKTGGPRSPATPVPGPGICNI